MNKAQLIDTLSGHLGSKKAATDAVEAVIDTITRAVANGEKVAITGFGVFEKVARPARTGRNPRTGESVRIKKTSVPKFKAGQSFKDVVSGAKKLPRVAASAARTATGAATRGATATPAKKTTARKAAPAAKKTTAKKAPAKKATSSRTVAKKATARKAAPAKKTTARKTTARKTASRGR